MIRSFLAISLPDDTADALVELQDGVRNARWIADDRFHVTLLFLGSCTPKELTDLDAALAGMRAERFDLKPEGVGAFGGGRPRQLYAGFAASEPLTRLHTKLERAAREAGILVERRKFVPHVTLARCGGGVIPAQAIDWTLRHARLSLPAFEVVEFGLWRSDLGTGDPVYSEMARYELAESK
jgi:2'-5' RNA ligase